MPKVSRFCLYPVSFLHRRARRMSGKNAGKFDICFYHHCPGAKQQKKRLVKGFFDFLNCPGRKAGYLGWAAAVPGKLTSVFIFTASPTEAVKKRLVKGVFNRGCCPGAEVRICRGCWMGCSRAQGGARAGAAVVRKFSFKSCKRISCPGAAGPEPGSSSPFPPNSCSLQVSFSPGLLCACWPALS